MGTWLVKFDKKLNLFKKNDRNSISNYIKAAEYTTTKTKMLRSITVKSMQLKWL